MVSRVAGTIAAWGRDGGYFATDEDADAFEAELTHILLHQMAAFNSPVWFNVGFEEHPQCSACFILSVEDTMESILDWNTKEGKIFRGGSGSGINLSNIRASTEHLSKGGTASRPGQLHARRRLLGRHDQVRRQDPPRGQDGRARHRPPRRPRLHLVQGQGGGEGKRAARRRLRHVDRRRGLHLDPVPERQQLGARVRRVHGARRARRGLGVHRPRRRLDRRHREGRRRAAPDRRRRVALRRSGRSVRHDHQRLAHLPELGPDQRVEPVLGVHARGRLGVQPRLDQPHEVPPRGRHLRHRRLRAHRRRPDPRAGDRRRRRRATRPRRSATTRARSASSAWATPTSARC